MVDYDVDHEPVQYNYTMWQRNMYGWSSQAFNIFIRVMRTNLYKTLTLINVKTTRIKVRAW